MRRGGEERGVRRGGEGGERGGMNHIQEGKTSYTNMHSTCT